MIRIRLRPRCVGTLTIPSGDETWGKKVEVNSVRTGTTKVRSPTSWRQSSVLTELPKRFPQVADDGRRSADVVNIMKNSDHQSNTPAVNAVVVIPAYNASSTIGETLGALQ